MEPQSHLPNPPHPAGLHNTQPKHDAGTQLLDPHQAQKGGKGRPRFCVTITRYGSRPLDVDNGAGGCKPLLDAIRYEGLIPDDDPATIEFQFRQIQVKKPYRRTEVLIEQIP
jgi:hypothetical protein